MQLLINSDIEVIMSTESQNDFELIREENRVYIQFSGAINITENQILNALKSSDFSSYKFDKELIKTIPETAKNNPKDESKKIDVAHVTDAEITFIISKDNMSAQVQVVTAQGGKKLSMVDIKRACQNNEIKFGLKTTLVKRLLKKTRQVEPGTLIEQKLVKGKPPVSGHDAYLKPKVKLFSELKRKHKVDEQGRFDLKDLGTISTVKEGQVVAVKIDATSGVDGVDIFGNQLTAEPGKDFELVAMDGTEISGKHPDRLVALKQGILRQTDNGIVVDDVYVVEKVTPRQGHIRFNGSVIVTGDVSPDMKIEATGDIIIGGYVESASIKSHGNITVSGGCSGHVIDESDSGGEGSETENYSCELVSENNVDVEFASQIKIVAKQDVSVKKALMNCQVTASNLFIGEPERGNGKLIGGKAFISKVLQSGFIGNASHVTTVITMNRVYDVFREKEMQLWNKVQDLNEKMEVLSETLLNQLPPEEKEKIQKQIAIVEAKSIKYSGYRKILVEKRREFIESIRIVVSNKIYPNSIIKIADKIMKIEEKKSKSLILVEADLLTIQPQ